VGQNAGMMAGYLLQLQNVVLLPHMGSGTQETRPAIARCAFANIAAHVAQQT
jgi:lactate dehydrogenase-like 2-hydroxyacid dehydrogenase